MGIFLSYRDAWKCGNVDFSHFHFPCYIFFAFFLRKNLQNPISSSYLCIRFENQVCSVLQRSIIGPISVH